MLGLSSVWVEKFTEILIPSDYPATAARCKGSI
jgi:hypothetical protein